MGSSLRYEAVRERASVAHGWDVLGAFSWTAIWSFVRERYFTFDRRSLGLFRIAFGILLLCDLLYRSRGISTWYVNDGLMPNHVVLWAKPPGPLYSFFLTLSSFQEVVWGFVVCGMVFLSYTLGYRTRHSQILAFICIVSLNSRLHMLENGGDTVVNILSCLTLFLPLGSRFSLDALRAAGVADQPWADDGGKDRNKQRFVSLACFALLLQLSLIYLFNVLNKSGVTWTDGTAVHYTLHQDRLVTALGVWLRETVPPEVLHFLTYATLLTEASAVVLIATPFATFTCRSIAAVLLPLLHLGFALCLDLGPFPYAMMCFFLLLVPSSAWQQASRLRQNSKLVRRIGLAFARLHSFSRGLQSDVQTVHINRAQRKFSLIWLREMAAGIILLSLLSAASQQNAAVPPELRLGYPAFAQAIIDSARMFQGWHMFAPDAPTEDFALSVDAVTEEGRHVDPYNEIASPNYPEVLSSIPPRLGQDQYFTSYSLFLPNDNFKGYRHILQNWILAYPERTGHPQDRIVSFKVLQLIDSSPPPGSTHPSDTRMNEIFHYP